MSIGNGGLTAVAASQLTVDRVRVEGAGVESVDLYYVHNPEGQLVVPVPIKFMLTQ